MRPRTAPLLLLVALLWPAACASLLEVDGDYDLAEAAGGAGSAGRSTGNGGAGGTATGGRSEAGGVPNNPAGGGGGNSGGSGTGGLASGGAPTPPDGQAPCPEGEKLCTVLGSDVCVLPDPSVGCGPSGCDQCQAPPGGFGVCASERCDFDCFDGFVRSGDACEPAPPPDAGRGGATGSGGAPGTCVRDADCPRCGAVPGCCTLVPTGRCGCNFVWCVPSL